MATTVEPIGSPHVVRSTSGGGGVFGGSSNERFVDKVVAMRWINRGFIFSILGGLQIAVVVLGLLTVSLLGAAMSHALEKTYAYFMVSGYSFFAFLFIVSFWCFMTSVILTITCATSVNTASTLIRTTFYLGYHGTAAAFYLFGSLALLIEGAKFEEIWIQVNHKKSENLKELVYTGGCIGMIEFILYLIITIFAVRKFRQPVVN